MLSIPKAVHYLGIVCGFVAGVAGIVAAVLFKTPAFGLWGGIFIACAVVGLVSGAVATPGGSISPLGVSATYKQVPPAAMIIVGALFVVGIVLTIFVFPLHR
jgi:hypothetical protein